MLRFFAVLLFFFVLNVIGCSHSVDPIQGTQNDPHKYTWTLDTLYYSGQSIIRDIWGANDTIVYAVGHESSAGRGSIWKYDGRRWTRINLLSPADYHFYTTYAIRGFGEKNIFVFGSDDSSTSDGWVRRELGIHFDGLQWKKMDLPPGDAILSMIAPSPNSIYCGGYAGKLFHYNGYKWSIDSIRSVRFPDVNLNVTVIGTTNNNGVYLQTEQWTPSAYAQQIVKYENSKYMTIDSAMNEISLGARPFWGGRSFWQGETGNIYSCGVGGIFQLSADKWKLFLSTDIIYSVYGANERHIFAVGKYDIYFFDGTAWESIRPHNYDLSLFDVDMWCSDTQIFIKFSNGARTFMLHGK
jgi:hypothetical protein